MINPNALARAFAGAADSWLCDGCSLVVRYIAIVGEGAAKVVDAQLVVQPLPASRAIDFNVRAGQLIAGQKSFSSLRKKELKLRVSEAIEGRIQLGRQSLWLEFDGPVNYHSEMPIRDRWFFDLHLQVWGKQLAAVTVDEVLREDHGLRTAPLPFDGVTDLANWLALTDRRTGSQSASISIRIGTPADILIAPTSLANDRLHVSVLAHSRLNLSELHLAARVVPGNGIAARVQMASGLKWKRPVKGLRIGSAEISVPNAESLLLVLTLGQYTVRRQWFEDPSKSANSKLIALQTYDKGLKQLRLSLLEPVDSRRFEKAIAGLAFLLGFLAAAQIESDAPDIVLSTPSGSMAILECTIKTSDVRVKVAKLVERRSALITALQTSRHSARVHAILICALPRDQIASETAYLAEQRVLVLTRENIEQGLIQVRFPSNADKLLAQAEQALASQMLPT